MVKSLVGLERENNKPFLMTRCNEGSLSDTLFLTKTHSRQHKLLSLSTLRLMSQPRCPVKNRHAEMPAGYSRFLLAIAGSKGSQNRICM
ncbi:hypothetical protein JOE25_002457 [Serratia sp. PL17]|nr:hypothetical protein [Serratia sp. PL17]